MAINLKTVVSKNVQIISSKMDDEVVMMSVEKGNYYGLNRIGSEIWGKLTEPITVQNLCNKLMKEFNVGKEQCEKDVIAYLEKLIDQGLIIVTESQAL